MRKRGNPVHGWVILDKPHGMTSTQAVAVVKRLFNAREGARSWVMVLVLIPWCAVKCIQKRRTSN